MRSPSILMTILALAGTWLSAQEFPWQQPHAEVKPNGDLALQQTPFQFVAGETLRYIDYENGSDGGDGTKASPWKHHPWDPAARGNAKSHSGPTTYVFKGGVTYRGELRPKGDRGTAAEPIRLTRDPSWGEGEARFYGSHQVTGGWQQKAHKDMPESGKVYAIDLDFSPRAVWMTDDSGDITRIKLARDPNWTVSDPDDLMSEWYVWDQPQWWKNNNNKTKVKGRTYHLGIDKDQLTGDAKDYVGGTVWSEWGFVMGSPYPSKIHTYDPGKKAITFHGPWTHFGSENVVENNRYYLEDRPQWLDVPGEYWFDQQGNQGGTLYVRLPGDADPNSATLEVGKVVDILFADHLEHVHISGLTFRFTNTGWEYNMPQWWKIDNLGAVVRLLGGGDDIQITHNTFEHVHMPVRISAFDEGNSPTPNDDVPKDIGTVRITDNIVRDTDHGAFSIENEAGDEDPYEEQGNLGHVDMLRNSLYRVGMRGVPGGHGHGISVVRPDTAHIAGNMLHRIGGWGISLFGGKSGGLYEVPYGRYLIHHNRIEDPLLLSNDWGGVETWQGGSTYVWNNVSINPGGFRYWGWHNRDGKSPRFGHAFYMDGAFKNFYFNNIAIGKANDPSEKTAAHAAFQEIIGFQNSVFNNTAYKFENGTRRQAPDVGRNKYLGNIFADISEWVFYHAKPPKGGFDPNAHHFEEGKMVAHETNAYAHNVMHQVKKHFGVFESIGKPYDSLDEMSSAMKEHGSMQASIGVMADEMPLRAPDEGDFRPAPGSAAIDFGVQAFVPWQLSRTVGEWHFNVSHKDPNRIIDEHWYQLGYYVHRGMYKDTPRYPLMGKGLTADDFVAGALEDWTPGGALKLAEDVVLTVSHAKLAEPFTVEYKPKKQKKQELTFQGSTGKTAKPTVDMQDNDFLIEVYFQTTDGDGEIASKLGGDGYALELQGGKPVLRLVSGGSDATVATGSANVADGEWQSLIVEVDRDDGVRMYVGGAAIDVAMDGDVGTADLSNSADFVVGKDLAATFDFMRVCRDTIASSGTSIEELHAWQFNGPQFRDFAGQRPVGAGRDAGALEAR